MHQLVCCRSILTNEPINPARAPRSTISQANPSLWFLTIKAVDPAKPTVAPPAIEAPRPKSDTPPFVPGGTGFHRMTEIGQDVFKMPNSLAHFWWIVLVKLPMVYDHDVPYHRRNKHNDLKNFLSHPQLEGQIDAQLKLTPYKPIRSLYSMEARHRYV